MLVHERLEYKMTHKKLTTALVAAVSTALLFSASAMTRVTAQASQAPAFQVDPTWPALPNNWVLGTVTSVTVGKDDHVWIVHRPRTVAEPKRAQAAPPVLEYDAAGKFVKAWGGDGQGYDWPAAEHGISADYKGNLWFTGSSPSGGSPDGPIDNMILKFTRDGKFLLQIGGRNQPGGNKDTKNLERAADIDVYQKTNEAFVADGYGNRRVIVFDADTGAFKRMWGAFGKPPDDEPPAAINRGGARGAAPAAAAVPPPPVTGEGSPRFANPVHGVKVSKDGLVYVADRTNRRIQVFDLTGKYITQVFINRTEGVSAAGLAFSPDAQQTYMYVADYGNSHLVVVNRKTLEVLYQVGKRSPAPGDFQGLHNLAADSKGNLYTAEVAPGNRAQKFVFKGMSKPPTQ
jgi:DNA-binding beta-propeller fold protein YncE